MGIDPHAFRMMEERLAAKLRLQPPPDDAAAPGTENSDLRPAVLQVIAPFGWLAFCGRTDGPTGRTLGELDLIVAADGGRTFWAELKTRTGKMSTNQLYIQRTLERLGHRHIIARSPREFLEKTR